MACTNKPLIKSQLILVKPPLINSCKRITVHDCQPKTNGELYQCTLQISKALALCADQTDALILWQQKMQQTTQP